MLKNKEGKLPAMELTFFSLFRQHLGHTQCLFLLV